MRPKLQSSKGRWVCFQIGAREHYSVPFELFSNNELELLVTDYWANSTFTFNKNLQGRRHRDLPDEKVKSFNFSSLSFEVYGRLRRSSGWELVMQRNEWFQKKAVNHLRKLEVEPTQIFSYSYAAKEIFRYAKARGWKTVLGQIDPGPLEEEIVSKEVNKYPQYISEWLPAPKAYWESWYQECELADKIVVNSEWSFNALKQKGVDVQKVEIVPLRYTPPAEAVMFHREYPLKFTAGRPMRVLFLGQVIMRKGIARVIEAAKLMLDQPVEFVVAGPIGIHPLPDLPNIKWVGRIPRVEVKEYFRQADVFLFPTLSDGFALTQLESFAWKLPIVTTPFCGAVVRHQHNGIVMESGSAFEIQETLMTLMSNPERLAQMSQHIDDGKSEGNS